MRVTWEEALGVRRGDLRATLNPRGFTAAARGWFVELMSGHEESVRDIGCGNVRNLGHDCPSIRRIQIAFLRLE